MDKECFSDNLELQEDPHCKFGLQNAWLGDLVTLKLQNCTLPCALPSAIVSLLKSLEELEVRDSATVEVLFDMNDTEITEIAFRLKILTLKGLSRLTHVWEKKKTGVLIFPKCNNPEIFLAQNPKIGDGMLLQLRHLTLVQVSAIRSIQSENSSWLNTICEKVHQLYVFACPHVETIGVHSSSAMSFSSLKKVNAYQCSRMQYLFTSSVAKKLVNLEEIRVIECKSLKEIVAKGGDEDEPKGEGGDKYENGMIFMKLENLTLISLDKLKAFTRAVTLLISHH